MTSLSGSTSATSGLLDARPMTWQQILVIAITVALNALDGFDVLSISFASPGISSDWKIDRAALGVVLSMELIGMAAGSILLGRAGDRYGRRPVALLCLMLMAMGMYLASTATGISYLSIYRIIAGLGIGGMLAVTNAIALETANARHRGISVSLMVIGYPLGVIFGGMVTAALLRENDWPIVFEFGAIVTLVMIPIVWLCVPETPAFLLSRRSNDTLKRLNQSLTRLGHLPETALPPSGETKTRGRMVDLFAPALARNTILLTLAYFTQIITFYFILKWTPKIVVDMGFHPSSAAGVLVWANVGGAVGGALFGFAVRGIGLKRLCIGVFVSSAIMVAIFGQSDNSLTTLSLLAALGGFCANAAMVGLYNLAAVTFPDTLRATGTGFVIGVGRGGAVLGPPVAGALFEAGVALPVVAAVMASGSLLALFAVSAMRLRATD